MLLLSLLLVAFVTYFIWKPFLTLAPASSYQTGNPSQQAFEQFQQQFKKHTHQNERPKEGYQGGEYIDFEEL